MATQIIDGKQIAKDVRRKLKPRIAVLREKGIVPGLAVVLVGEDLASQTYVRSKGKACERLKLYSETIRKDGNITQEELIEIIKSLNTNDKIHGILVQSPVPSHIDELAVTLTIAPEKDVDGFHPYNVGMMLLGRGGLLPCTPNGILKLLEESHIDPTGKEVVIVGRSNIVGKPVATLLMQKAKIGNATVTVAHSRSKNLAEICKRADILIAAIGKPEFIKEDMLKDDVVIIDVGVNRIDDGSVEKGYRLVGDVDYKGCFEKASYITPVPGGVGPMTISMLMENTVTAAEKISGLS
ncbi:MAG TPA: bifunctional 5,10-methylene-tetrahydrofolate dehydrogenase/5,10-methylene-tetrahydrofolate cyclohydrolase [candidate division Zixibacteria bacterium]|nr:bifunctional 5,10-methylene-tetrahydrofolate dehydrogenase/5,10-methylene-tetrahydrofolate cyclohydrolase [candidate division Zixibacteria bacterium]